MRKKNTTKKPTLLKKLKELEAEADDDEEIVSDLIPQSNSDHNNESRDHIIKKSTVLPKRICEIGYNSFTIMHFLEFFSQKKDRYNKNSLGAIGKREY